MKNHGLSEKLVRATLDTLYINGIVEVWSVGKSKGKHSNYYRLNYEKFKEYEQYSMDELKKPSLKIETIKGYNLKGYSPSYLKNEYSDIPKESPTVPQELPKDFPSIPQITNNIDNIEIIDNINNKENIENKDIIEIENNNINIEDSYLDKIIELIDEGKSVESILIQLAKSDFGCFNFYKKKLKEDEDFKTHYTKLLPLINHLIEEYEPQ